ncbi:MAG: response regulator [Mariprofundus sp.]|nr:response regulator [Mariprofundus sp.]
MKILIVDDSPTNVLLLKRLIMTMKDCEPICFTEPLAALEWCEKDEPDLLLIDYMMPDIDGLKFVHRFRKFSHCIEVPVIMITAEDKKETRYKALEAGVTDFLTKPVDKIEFNARTNNMLHLRKSQVQLANRANWLSMGIKQATKELRQQEQQALQILSKAAEYKDPETGAHILRMSRYAQLISRSLGCDEAEQAVILEAAPMHDVGKIAVPDAILLKPGRLTVDEFEIMKQHALQGSEILKQGSSRILIIAAEIAVSHHEKFNGKGYPYGLLGEAIPMRGRIVAVADVFDALTSVRPYKKAWTVEDALKLLTDEKGEHFDPQCVDAFIASLPEALEIMERFRED